ncbi:MAG: hypothetical protein IKW15_01405 [Bacteroidales bacterium]|nr:hypothetical protein [Bacteroidales bacterium]
MNLRSILNRLTEAELELLQEGIEEGDLYGEIEKVIDDKNQPSLFGQNIHEGDVYTEIDAKGVKLIYLIVAEDNPSYCVNSFRSNGVEVVYVGSFWCKVNQMQNWEKRDECLWLAVQNAYDKLCAERMKLNMEFARHFESLLDGSCEI